MTDKKTIELLQIANAKLTQMMSSRSITRSDVAQSLGMSFGTNRDLYQQLGYPKTLNYEDFLAQYQRQDLASACIKKPVRGSWKRLPFVTDDPDPKKETEFEKAVNYLIENKGLWGYLRRVDTLACIGQYSVMYFGVPEASQDNAQRLDQALIKANGKMGENLLYLSVYGQNKAEISKYVTDKNSENYGMPEIYKLTPLDPTNPQRETSSLAVHASRIIHYVNDPLESDILGEPSLMDIYNRLKDVELISGGSAEMYWEGARPGYGLKADAEADFDTKAKSEIEAQIQNFQHKLNRFLRFQGIEIQNLAPQVFSPKEQIFTLVSLIASAKEIPMRILLGSERGELASSQDKDEWNETCDVRRRDHNEPRIIRPTIDRFIEVGVLPEPKDGRYVVDWPEMDPPGEKNKMEVAKAAAAAIATYANSAGAEYVFPIDMFLERFFDLTPEDIEQVKKMVDDVLDDENNQIDLDDNDIEDNPI